jgi:hypothetical protein
VHEDRQGEEPHRADERPGLDPITNEQCNDVTVHYTYDTYALANGTAKAVTSRAATPGSS